jgi:hypothetical protein
MKRAKKSSFLNCILLLDNNLPTMINGDFDLVGYQNDKNYGKKPTKSGVANSRLGLKFGVCWKSKCPTKNLLRQKIRKI